MKFVNKISPMTTEWKDQLVLNHYLVDFDQTKWYPPLD